MEQACRLKDIEWLLSVHPCWWLVLRCMCVFFIPIQSWGTKTHSTLNEPELVSLRVTLVLQSDRIYHKNIKIKTSA